MRTFLEDTVVEYSFPSRSSASIIPRGDPWYALEKLSQAVWKLATGAQSILHSTLRHVRKKKAVDITERVCTLEAQLANYLEENPQHSA